MNFLINQQGSVEDIRCTLRGKNSLKALQIALEDEQKKAQPRTTVVKMLQVAIRRTQKEEVPA